MPISYLIKTPCFARRCPRASIHPKPNCFLPLALWHERFYFSWTLTPHYHYIVVYEIVRSYLDYVYILWRTKDILCRHFRTCHCNTLLMRWSPFQYSLLLALAIAKHAHLEACNRRRKSFYLLMFAPTYVCDTCDAILQSITQLRLLMNDAFWSCGNRCCK